MNCLQRILRVGTGEVQVMNTMHKLRRWCLVFVAMATATFAAPGFAKNFYAELVDAAGQPTFVVPNGGPTPPITIRLKVYNTSTEPATINSIVLCNLPGVTLTGVVAGTGSGTLGTYAPVGNEVDQCGGAGGRTLTDFTGIRRNNNKTFHILATVNATCSTNLTTWPVFASTGNTFSSVTKFTNDAPTQTAFGCDVALSCSPPQSYTEVSGGNTTTIERLPKPGFGCDPVVFNVFFTDFDNTVEIVWTSPAVMLKTTTHWPDSWADPVTTQGKQTWVAWEKDQSNNPIFIPVPACTSSLPLTATTDPFPFISSTAELPDGSPHPYAKPIPVQARICAIEESFEVLANGSTCPQPPPGPVVLGCIRKDTILFIRDDIFIANR